LLGSLAEVEEVLGALRQTLPLLGLELNLRKTTVWGPGLVHASSPLTAATRLHLEEGTEVLGVPIHSPFYHAPVGTHLGTLKGKFARRCAAVAAVADAQCTHAPMRSMPGSRKGTVCPPHLTSPSHGGLRGGHYCNPEGHVGRGGGHAHVRYGVGADHPADE